MLRYITSVLVLSLFLISQAYAGTIKGVVEGGKRIKKSPAVVYLVDVKGRFKPPETNPVMDQRNMTFIPHVLPVLKGTTVDFLNNDEVRHNVFSPDHERYNLGTWPRGEIKQYTFNKKGVYSQLCNVHPEMEAFIVVLDNPFFSLTDKRGRYEIRDIPPGRYKVKVWHEKLRFKKQTVEVPATGAVTLNFKRKR
jgi:plastocyanin